MKNKIWSIGAGLLLFVIWYHYFMPAQAWEKLPELKIGWLAIASLTFLLAFCCRAMRWGLILKPIKKIATSRIIYVYMAGAWINYLFPVRVVGEVFKSYQLKQKENLPISLTLPTVFVEKFYAISVMITSLVFLPLFSFRLHNVVATALAAVGVIYLIMLVFIFGSINQKERLGKVINFCLFFLPRPTQLRTMSLAESFIDGLALIKREGIAVLGLIGVSFLVAVLDAINFYAFFQAVNLPITLVACYFGSCLLNLFYFLPAPPGSVGTNEMYGTLVFVFGFGYQAELTSLAILTGHGINALVLAVLGTIALSSLGGHLKDIETVPLEVT